MTAKMFKRINLIFLGFLILSVQVFSQVITYDIHPESKIMVKGTSTIHDWSIDVNKFSGTVAIKESVAQNAVPKKGDTFENLEIRMEVKSMESGRGAAMDNRTFDALKAESHPEIVFTLKKSEITEIKDAGNGTFVMNAAGDLTIAGVTKPIDITVEGQKLKDGRFVFSGSKSLKMTEFGVKPPSAMFGTIVAGDDITVLFEQLTLQQNNK
jgi:polyisoprenoid-binding protein YceI